MDAIIVEPEPEFRRRKFESVEEENKPDSQIGDEFQRKDFRACRKEISNNNSEQKGRDESVELQLALDFDVVGFDDVQMFFRDKICFVKLLASHLFVVVAFDAFREAADIIFSFKDQSRHFY